MVEEVKAGGRGRRAKAFEAAQEARDKLSATNESVKSAGGAQVGDAVPGHERVTPYRCLIRHSVTRAVQQRRMAACRHCLSPSPSVVYQHCRYRPVHTSHARPSFTYHVRLYCITAFCLCFFSVTATSSRSVHHTALISTRRHTVDAHCHSLPISLSTPHACSTVVSNIFSATPPLFAHAVKQALVTARGAYVVTSYRSCCRCLRRSAD